MVLTALIILLGLAACPGAAAAIWLEGEQPSIVPAGDPAQLGYTLSAAVEPDRLSNRRYLNLALDASKADAVMPDDGLVFGYQFTTPTAAVYSIWARIGYEWARSDFDWRVNDGGWTTLHHLEATTDLTELAAWVEVAWIKLGAVPLGAGAHTVYFRHLPPRARSEKPARILHSLDALCITTGAFRPNGPHAPGAPWQDARDRAAAAAHFSMPGAAGPAHTRAALSGVWQIARWDEDDVPPAQRLAGVTQLPDHLDQLHWYAIDVPSDRSIARPELKYAHRLIYRTQIAVPHAMQGRSWQLEFEAFNLIASVFVNRQFCDWSRAHDAPWLCDVTSAIRPGATNEIVVVLKDFYYGVDATRSERVPPGLGLRYFFNTPLDAFTRAWVRPFDMCISAPHGAGGASGLLEPVWLIAAGSVYTADVFAKPSVQRKELGMEITVRNTLAADALVTVENELVRWQAGGAEAPVEKRCAPRELRIPAGGTSAIDVREPWDAPALWWPDDPRLYWIVTTLKRGTETLDVRRTRFGFREWGWHSNIFLLNGTPWQFWCDTYGSGDPRRFIEESKRCGRTMLRYWRPSGGWGGLSHRQVLELCDEYGMVVRESSAWDGELANYGGMLTVRTNGETVICHALIDNVITQQTAWVKGYRNHPSVLIWSLENEITYISSENLGAGPYFEPWMRYIGEVIMQLDPTRPVMVDGGNALRPPDEWRGAGVDDSLRALGFLPVNGAHYVESHNTIHLRDYPDAAYTAEHWYTTRQRAWPMVRGMPIFHGEIFYARGWNAGQLAALGGEECFSGDRGTFRARGLMMRMLNEGYRWSGASAAWQLYCSPEDADRMYYAAWQPVQLLCRQWNWTFGGGATVTRDLMLLNQTSKPRDFEVVWEVRVGGAFVAGATQTWSLGIGETKAWPIEFTLPAVAQRSAGALALRALHGESVLYHEEKPLHVLPRDAAPAPAPGGSIIVYDPHGAAAARLAQRGIPFTSAASLDALPEGHALLVIGHDAIPSGRTSDTRWQRLALSGAKILVLEQEHPLRYQSLPGDFEVTAHGGRIAFPEDSGHAVFAGLSEPDFMCWSGDHRCFKHAYRKPSRGAHSLIQCDYNLSDTALAECRLGDGVIILCQMLVGEKLASDAVAQTLFDNLVNYAAAYHPVRKRVAVAMAPDAPERALLKDIRLQADDAATPLDALRDEYEIAVIAATPENLQTLADARARLDAFTARGGWLMLWGLTPDGLAAFNTLAGVQHVIRPFTREYVALAQPRDPLAAGLTLRDVVMSSGERIASYRGTEWRDEHAFSYVVDVDDIAPFCTINGHPPMRDVPRAPHPRNVANGLDASEFWQYLYYMEVDQGHEPRVIFALPREEEITQLSIVFDAGYQRPTEITLYYDDDPAPVVLATQPDDSLQTFALAPRRARTLALEISAWDKVHARDVLGIGMLWLNVRRPAAFTARVHPLLNIGALVRYTIGTGGIVLNQVQVLPQERNPANAAKKATIVKTLLSNLGAVCGENTPVIAGAGVSYQPVAIGDAQFTAYLNRAGQPGWFRAAQVRDADFSSLPRGEHTMRDIRFHISDFGTSPVPSVLMLAGDGSDVKMSAVNGIRIERTAGALFFLHTYNPGNGLARMLQERGRRGREQGPPAPVLFRYRVTYADGVTDDIPVRWGEEIGAWYSEAPQDMRGAVVAWSAPIPGDAHTRMLAAYAMQWNNPRPGVQIAALDVMTDEEGRRLGAPAVLAITCASPRGGE